MNPLTPPPEVLRRRPKSINATGELDIVRTVRAAGYALDTELCRHDAPCASRTDCQPTRATARAGRSCIISSWLSTSCGNAEMAMSV